MKANIIYMLIATILFLHGCAQTQVTKMKAVTRTSDQKTAYDGTVTSQKKHFVSISPYKSLDGAIVNFDLSRFKTIFMLAIENGGNAPIHIGYDNISVAFQDNSEDSMEHKVDIQLLQEMLPGFIIKQQAIMPGETYSSMLICDTSNINTKTEGRFKIVVSIDNEEHKFIFNRGLNK